MVSIPYWTILTWLPTFKCKNPFKFKEKNRKWAPLKNSKFISKILNFNSQSILKILQDL